jgi:hypothetical protein
LILFRDQLYCIISGRLLRKKLEDRCGFAPGLPDGRYIMKNPNLGICCGGPWNIKCWCTFGPFT